MRDAPPSPRSYFVRSDERRVHPTRASSGAWNPDELHVSPVNGLVMHELERWLAERPPDDKLVTRISSDYLGVLGFDECDVTCEVIRTGRSVELVEVVVTQNERAAIRTRIWRVSASDTTTVAGGAREPLPPPEQAAPLDLSTVWAGDYVASVDLRTVGTPAPGRAAGWITTALSVVEDEPVSDLTRFALLVDTMNGVAVRRPPQEWLFPNVDLTIHLFRQPRGPWLGLETEVTFGPTGHGRTSSELHDGGGHVGHAEQSLLVRPR
jgi:Thioesterase-like superfamily